MSFTVALVEQGVGVVVLSWWGPPFREQSFDTQGVTTDGAIPLVLKVAEEERMKGMHLINQLPTREP